ncbi:MAG TPA: HAD family hydrolase [Syntrophomonadaceae bacterium]|nr:HAD family hydrolase [Syntrophomonadaceae bacterium]
MGCRDFEYKHAEGIILLEAVTFDFWNTLYKGPPDAIISEQRGQDVRQVLLGEGLDFSLEDLQAAFKSAWKEAYCDQRIYGQDIGPLGQLNHALNYLGISRGSLNHSDDLYQAYTSTLLKFPPELNDGTLETLQALQGRFKLAVICNTGATPGVLLRRIMEQDSILDFFACLVFSDEVGFAKPNPLIFHLALENLKASSQAALHVGDDAITDVIGAKKAGMKAVWLEPRAVWPLIEADYHIKALPELLSLL